MQSIILEKDRETLPLDVSKMLPYVQEHFLRPKMLLYYVDFTLSFLIANTSLIFATHWENGSLLQIACLIIAAFSLYRASAFIHECVHNEGKLKIFKVYYNIMHGMLHKIPFYCYPPHRQHHQFEIYGTSTDPEYDILSNKSAFYNLLVMPFFMPMIATIFMVVRWGIVPIFLPFIGKRRREWIYINASSFIFNPRYKRAIPSTSEKQEWYAQDACCFVYSIIFGLMIYNDVLPLHIVPLWLITLYLANILNVCRAILSHRYLSEFDPMTRKQMILDSITLPHNLLNVLVFPLGLGYHALHHIFPQIPYHNLQSAHEWLMHSLPENHPYRITVIKSYGEGMQALLSKKF